MRLALVTLLSLAATVALTVHSAQAQVTVYDNGVNTSNVNLAYTSDPGGAQFIADTFTLPGMTTFNQVTFLGFYNTGLATDNFTISFYSTTGGIPDTLPFSNGVPGSLSRTDTGLKDLGFELYSYEATLVTPLTLPTGTYGIGITNSPSVGVWSWAISTSSSPCFIRSAETIPWNPQTGDTAFTLRNSIAVAPEPASLAFLGMAALPLVGIVRRRKV